jgi:hypothetical protein
MVVIMVVSAPLDSATRGTKMSESLPTAETRY